jgi:hypothetical protein
MYEGRRPDQDEGGRNDERGRRIGHFEVRQVLEVACGWGAYARAAANPKRPSLRHRGWLSDRPQRRTPRGTARSGAPDRTGTHGPSSHAISKGDTAWKSLGAAGPNPARNRMPEQLQARTSAGQESSRIGLSEPADRENGGGTRTRTGGDGFAIRCLSHLAMPPLRGEDITACALASSRERTTWNRGAANSKFMGHDKRPPPGPSLGSGGSRHTTYIS